MVLGEKKSIYTLNECNWSRSNRASLFGSAFKDAKQNFQILRRFWKTQCRHCTRFITFAIDKRMNLLLGTRGSVFINKSFSSYCQVEVSNIGREKDVLTWHQALYAFRRVPFGLKNASAAFPLVIDTELFTVEWQNALVYLEDVAIFSINAKYHSAYTRMVSSLFEKASVELKLNKCQSFTNRIDHVVCY